MIIHQSALFSLTRTAIYNYFELVYWSLWKIALNLNIRILISWLFRAITIQFCTKCQHCKAEKYLVQKLITKDYHYWLYLYSYFIRYVKKSWGVFNIKYRELENEELKCLFSSKIISRKNATVISKISSKTAFSKMVLGPKSYLHYKPSNRCL